MLKFVMKDDKIRDSKHEKHGVRFTSFAIKAPQKRLGKKKYQQIKCRNSAQKNGQKVVKYVNY